ncbi:MAG: hypothetical protein K2X86_06490 [Cytophagaceae bacterium]|nr:hypothetical protein [Cytophagaceae bacterium]
MKHIFIKTTALVMVAGLMMFSCKDAEKPDMDANTTADNANSQGMFDDAMKVSEDALTSNGSAKLAGGGTGISCATVDTIVISGNTKKFTITFTNTACSDGKIRSGTITATLVGATYNTPGATLDIVTTNYTVNGTTVQGRKKITCMTGGNNAVHNIVVSDTAAAQSGYAKITYSGGKEAYWKSKRTRTLFSGGGNGTITDNVYDISATSTVGNPVAEGINKEGRNYVVNIISPIRVDFNCFANNTARYPTQGVLELIPNGKSARTIDYGNGTCDNIVKVGVGGKTYTVNLSY